MTSKDGLMSTTNSENYHFIKEFDEISDQYDLENTKWIKQLRADGYKAAHPNDGWVNRELNKVQFVYPHFNDNPKIGDKIMLGWHTNDNNISAIVTKVDHNSGIINKTIIYHFKKIN